MKHFQLLPLTLLSFAEYQARLALERSGSGSGDDEDDDDDRVKGEGSGDDNWYQLEGVKRKEDFIPFEEFHKKENGGVEMREDFIPFDKDHSGNEQSGEEDDNQNGVDRGENFIPFDEETNSAQSGDNAAYFAKL